MYNMSLRRAVVDIQGFHINGDFEVKEFTLLDLYNDYILHLHLKSSTSFKNLNGKDRGTVRFLEDNHHKLKYNQGWMDQSVGLTLIDSMISSYDEIYVKGNQKNEFLKKRASSFTTIIDLAQEGRDDEIILRSTRDPCWFHIGSPAICSQNNALVLKNFICNNIIV